MHSSTSVFTTKPTSAVLMFTARTPAIMASLSSCNSVQSLYCAGLSAFPSAQKAEIRCLI